MRIRPTKKITIGPNGITFDGWDVLLGGAIACWVVGGWVDNAPGFLVWLGLAHIVVWVVALVLNSARARRGPGSTEGGGQTGGVSAGSGG
jgi:hypothetical protein